MFFKCKMCVVCFFCLGFLFVWRQLCWVFNILCRFLKGWESKTARNSVLLHAECAPSQCSKLICTERICYLKKAFQKIHKGLEIHKNPMFFQGLLSVCFRKKNVKLGFWWYPSSPFVNHNGFGGLRLCQRIFYGLQTARGEGGTPRCSCAFPLGEIGRGSKLHRETNPGSEPECFWSFGAFDSHFFPNRLSKTTISKYHPKKIPTTTIFQQTSFNIRIRIITNKALII